jgi:hypothetical protein
MLAGFDLPFGLAQTRGINKHDFLLFGSGIKEVAGHLRGNFSIPCGWQTRRTLPGFSEMSEFSAAADTESCRAVAHRMSQPAKRCQSAELPMTGRMAVERKTKSVPQINAGCTRPNLLRS